MKSQEKITNSTSGRKMLKLFICILLPFLANAQRTGNLNNVNYSFDESQESFRVASFKVKCVEGQSYAMWTVIEPTDNAVYLLERSSDNKNFKPICVKAGAKSPINLELLYSYIDNDPIEGISFYRIKRLDNEGAFISEVIRVDTKQYENTDGDVLADIK